MRTDYKPPKVAAFIVIITMISVVIGIIGVVMAFIGSSRVSPMIGIYVAAAGFSSAIASAWMMAVVEYLAKIEFNTRKDAEE